MPRKPNIKPTTTPLLGLTPPGRSPFNNAIHSGTVPINNAVKPDGTCCSAHTTPPLPPKSNKPPTTVAASQCDGDGCGVPRHRVHAYRIAPAMKKRMPAITNGG